MMRHKTQLKLHEYQKKACAFIWRRYSVYLMLDCGLGKTPITIEFAKERPETFVVFAPPYAATVTWPAELKKWWPEATYTVLHGKHKDKRLMVAPKKKFIILPYSSMKWFYTAATNGKFQMPPQGCKYIPVWDESSMLKSKDTKRFEMIRDMEDIWSYYRLALSATPAPNNFTELWSQYYLLDGGKRLMPEYYWFRSRYFDYDATSHDVTIKDGAEAHVLKCVDDITVTMKAEDYLNMPELNVITAPVSLPSKLRKEYEELEEEFILEYPDATVIANTQGAMENKLRQFLQGALYYMEFEEVGMRQAKYLHDIKAKWLKEFMTTRSGNPVLAAIDFKFEKEIVRKVLGYEVPCIDGECNNGSQLIEQWNQGKLPLLLVHPASVAYSLNLQYGGSTLVWLCLPWSYQLYYQLVRRLYRQGQQKRVMVILVMFKDTMDSKVGRVLRRKDCNQQLIYSEITSK